MVIEINEKKKHKVFYFTINFLVNVFSCTIFMMSTYIQPHRGNRNGASMVPYGDIVSASMMAIYLFFLFLLPTFRQY